MAVMLTFRSAERLATAYGVSVTGALVIDTVLMLVVARVLWHWQPWKLALAAVAFGGVELTFLSANLSKVLHGGWLPLLIAVVRVHRHDDVAARAGRSWRPTAGSRRARSSEFVDDALRAAGCPGSRGTAVFPHPGKDTTPLALRANVEHNQVLHENVLIVSASSANVPHVPGRGAVHRRPPRPRGRPHPAPVGALRLLRRARPARGAAPGVRRRACSSPGTIDVAERVVLPLPRRRSGAPGRPGMAQWRKVLFLGLARNAADPAAYFGLPVDRTVTMGSPVDV